MNKKTFKLLNQSTKEIVRVRGIVDPAYPEQLDEIRLILNPRTKARLEKSFGWFSWICLSRKDYPLCSFI